MLKKEGKRGDSITSKITFYITSHLKAQSSLEFIVLAGVMTFFFLVFFATIGEQMIGLHQDKNNKVAQDILDAVRDEIELAQGSLGGYQRIFTLPETVEGDEYSIRLYQDTLIVRYKDRFYERTFSGDISGNVFMGENELIKKGDSVLLNSNDPCTDSDPADEIFDGVYEGNNSFCIAAECWCFPNSYHMDCDGEDDIYIGECAETAVADINNILVTKKGTTSYDFTVAPGNGLVNSHEYTCSDFDFCNSPPEFIDNPAIKDPEGIGDTWISITFRSDEDVRANVFYAPTGEKPTDVGEEWPYVFESMLFNKEQTVTVRNLAPQRDYTFLLVIYDKKRANSTYGINGELTARTSADITAPIINKVKVLPTQIGSAGADFTIRANITEYTDVENVDVTATLFREDTGAKIATTALFTYDEESNLAKIPNSLIYTLSFTFTSSLDPRAGYGFEDGMEDFTSFYASFDSGADADYPLSATAIDSSGTEVGTGVPGKFANGIRVDGDDALIYDAKDFNLAEGTVEFWVQPNGWDSEENIEHRVLFDRSKTNQNHRLRVFVENNDLHFQITTINDENSEFQHVITKKDINWQSGEWHHVAVTWDLDGAVNNNGWHMELYTDGNTKNNIGDPAQLKKDIPLQDAATAKMSLGCSAVDIDAGETCGFQADAVFDQFRILNRWSNAGDILAHYILTRTYVLEITAIDSTGLSSSPISLGLCGTGKLDETCNKKVNDGAWFVITYD